MSIDYEKIKQENTLDWGRRIGELGPIVLANLYSDSTHFVYELLQNAEDASATSVTFRLYPNRLEFDHDGRLFNEDDVRGICGLVQSTKKEDLTKIGKFGIGFKSVYAHTSSPEIYSDETSFAVDNFVWPREIDSCYSGTGTRFILPFNHQDKSLQESFDSISERLKDLGIRTLLFLKSIDRIEYEIEGVTSGSYTRQSKLHTESDFVKVVTVIGRSDQSFSKEENWLVFNRGVPYKDYQLSVEIAFLIADSDYEFLTCPRFHKLQGSTLSVFFPTDKETHLGFLMQGPYRTTPSRDNIPANDKFNIKLIEETGELVVESLRWLRNRGWLNAQVLETMPLAYIERDYWNRYQKQERNRFKHTLFEPIYKQVLSAIRNESLIPAHDGGYIDGKHAILAGSGELRNLLDDSQLNQLIDAQQAGWISSDISERRTRNLWKYLRDMVDIEEIDLNKFIRKLSSVFFEEQSDQWMVKFYEVANQFERHSIYGIRTQPIIRLKGDTHVAPYDNAGNPCVFLPSEQISRFPTVKAELCKSIGAMEFLRDKLELQAPDLIDEVRRYVLPKYKNRSVSIDAPDHIDDISVMLRAMQADSVESRKRNRLIEDLKSLPILQATNSENITRYCSPADIYFRSPELEIYFEDNPHAWFASPDYNLFRDSLSDLRVESNVRIQREGWLRFNNRVIIEQRRGWHVHGINGFDPDCTIDGLEFALNNPSFARSQYIWNRLLLRNKFLVKGIVESSTRQDFYNPTAEARLSKIGERVVESDWLPDPNGQYVKPSALSLDDLPEGFIKDDELATMLGIGTSSHEQVRDLVVSFGIEDDESATQDILQFIELRKSNPRAAKRLLSQPKSESTFTTDDEVEQEVIDYRSAIYEVFNRPIASSRSSAKRISTQSRDLEEVKDDLDSAKSLEPEESNRKHAILTKRWEGKNEATRTFLHSQYDGRCQICDFTFAKRSDGSPYFEGVYLVSYKRARWLDRPGNVLCLCANHVSEFLYGTVEALDIFDQITSYHHGELHDLEIELCENIVKVRFTRDHITELIALLESE